MIGYIKGTLQAVENDPTKEYLRLIILPEHIGYVVLVPRNNETSALKTGQACEFWISNIIREDSNTLYGFLSDIDRRLFEQIIGVSGIGPKIALALFSSLSHDEIIIAVQNDDIKALSRTSGLGNKGASKIILELKGKLVIAESNKEKGEKSLFANTKNSEIAENVADALVNLGFKRGKANEAAIIASEHKNNVEDALRMALQSLQK